MKLDVFEFSQLSIQAKVSFVEWLGQKMLPKLQGASLEAASNGLNLIAKWRESQEVSGDDLSLALMNEEDEGIYAYSNSQSDSESNSAVEVVGGAVSYAAWRVYKYTNKRMPQEYERASDEFVQWILDQVEKSGALSSACISNALRYLYAYCKNPSEILGEVVEICEIDAAANSHP